MRLPVVCLLTSLLVLNAAATTAATLTSRFTNAERIDTLYLWTETSSETDRFAIETVTTGRSMADWSIGVDAERDRAVLYGTAVDARSGLIRLTGRYQPGASPLLAFATVVWEDDRNYELKTSGVLALDGRRWRDTGRPFLRHNDIVNPRAPTTVVPVPGAGRMMCAALVLLPLLGTVRRR